MPSLFDEYTSLLLPVVDHTWVRIRDQTVWPSPSFPAQSLERIYPTFTDSLPSRLRELATEPDSVQGKCYKQAVESTFRLHLTRLISSSATPAVTTGDEDSSAFRRGLAALFDLTLVCEQHGFVDSSLPVSLLEDFCRDQTLDRIMVLFAGYLEHRLPQLSHGMVATRGKGLILLRVCNNLLRRCSQTRHSAFAGRVLLYIANAFPLSDRSGVNVRGDFNSLANSPNTTTASTMGAVDLSEAALASLRGVGNDESKESLAKLYADLWSLPRHFSDPPRLFNPTEFSSFRGSLDSVITHFRHYAQENVSHTNQHRKKRGRNTYEAPSSSVPMGTRGSLPAGSPMAMSPPDTTGYAINGANGEEEDFNLWNPKYLCSPGLFELQLSDVQFRRQILLQALITLRYLTLFTAANKAAIQALPSANKQVQLDYTLSEDNYTWVESARGEIQRLWDTTDDGGHMFRTTAQAVLRHDMHWVDWKNRNCPAWELPSVLPILLSDLETERERMVHRAIAPIHHTRLLFAMGTPGLTQLWGLTNKVGENGGLAITSTDGDDDDPLADLRSEKRRKLVPEMEAYFQHTMREYPTADDMDFMTETELDFHQARAWRALRLASRSHLRQFPLATQNYVQTVYKNIFDPEPPAPKKKKKTPSVAMATEGGEGGSASETEADAEGEGESKVDGKMETMAAEPDTEAPEPKDDTEADGDGDGDGVANADADVDDKPSTEETVPPREGENETSENTVGEKVANLRIADTPETNSPTEPANDPSMQSEDDGTNNDHTDPDQASAKTVEPEEPEDGQV
ncbi:THO complex subunit 1 transcription elongation factor-domain-containing protein [Dimargaris cristalligena]|uniref:THO complex subunit 1 transcription elongation factor-domain-containing protein n=1 Tax=Dimargaris cristalligena TaxID=215637 RepID=A0A4P9ZXY2_9FUNG|nr:THO complex subunit 1 transcription elongation factor-domain-containing protein [Dimargaris cristalligena]|eukprot:RKP37610.1 THO complex subunit 1 transcription elongation factor-domain-containing protein [Dimargaris cristalligena]